MNGCLGVILSEMIHPNSSFMNISAQSDASGHPKTTLNFTQSGLTSFPERLRPHPLPFNPCLAHARPHRRPESKIHPDRTKLAHPKYITALTKNGHSTHTLSQRAWLASLSNSYIKSFHLSPKIQSLLHEWMSGSHCN